MTNSMMWMAMWLPVSAFAFWNRRWLTGLFGVVMSYGALAGIVTKPPSALVVVFALLLCAFIAAKPEDDKQRVLLGGLRGMFCLLIGL